MSVLINKKQLSVLPLVPFGALRSVSYITCYCDVKQFSDIALRLASLWDLDVVEVHCSWVANLTAAGLIDNAREVRFSIMCVKGRHFVFSAGLSINSCCHGDVFVGVFFQF